MSSPSRSPYASRKFIAAAAAAALLVFGEMVGANFRDAALVLLSYAGIEGAADLKAR